MKALWAAGIERRVNLKMLFNFITIGYVENPIRPEETFFEKILKLPPASLLYYTPANKELFIEKYWDIDPDIQNKSISDDEAIGKFAELFAASVKRRLRSDVPIGTSLSGGLDSSSIVAAIDKLQSVKGLHCTAFTGSFPGFEKDESAFARQVASKFGLPHQIVVVSVKDFIE